MGVVGEQPVDALEHLGIAELPERLVRRVGVEGRAPGVVVTVDRQRRDAAERAQHLRPVLRELAAVVAGGVHEADLGGPGGHRPAPHVDDHPSDRRPPAGRVDDEVGPQGLAAFEADPDDVRDTRHDLRTREQRLDDRPPADLDPTGRRGRPGEGELEHGTA